MSYLRNTHRFFYAPTFVEFNAEHFSQPGVRPKWQEVVRFMKSVFFDPKPSDPTDSYADVEGGLRFDSTQHKFKYRDNVNWKYFGTGDGDVRYDGDGAVPKADTGVARWSPRIDSTGNWIQGSLVEIDDLGNLETPGTYFSLNNGVGHRAFLAQKALGFTDFVIGNDGTHVWGGDTTLQRSAAQQLEFSGTNARFFLSGTGDTKLEARKHLGAIGNSIGGNLYRCPVTGPGAGFVQNSDSGSAVPIGDPWVTSAYNVVIPANAMATDGDMMTLTMFLETSNSALVKRVGITFKGDSRVAVISGGATYSGIVVVRVLRMSASQGILQIIGNYEGSMMSSSDWKIYRSDMDWTTSNAIVVDLQAISGGGVVPAGEIKHNGANVTYHCQ